MIESLLCRIARHLDREKIPYMVIGGQAVLIYGSPRLTRDIDITLGVDTDCLKTIRKALHRLRLKPLAKNAAAFARKTKVFPVADLQNSIRIDFIFSFTPYEKQAIARAKKVKFKGYPVKFASCEDLIIHKLFAGRAIDEEDIRNILLKHRRKINPLFIRRHLAYFAELPGQEDIIRHFNALWREAGSHP